MRLQVKNLKSTRVQVAVNVELTDPSQDVNVTLPVTPATSILFAGDVRVMRFFVKKDPSKENWAPMKLTIMSEQLSNNTSYTTSTGGASGTTTAYTSTGVGTSTAAAPYVPSGGDQGGSSVKIACRNCTAMEDYGQTFCSKCGESMGDDDYDSY